ncbi:MAG: tetratricopeptide repeat protein, partial [Candidatus Adiutrix sp.]
MKKIFKQLNMDILKVGGVLLLLIFLWLVFISAEKKAALELKNLEQKISEALELENNLKQLLNHLNPAIRAEILPLNLKEETLDYLEGLRLEKTFQHPLLEALINGALAFLSDDLSAAAQNFDEALNMRPDDGEILSFKAATAVRLGNTAHGGELYLRALEFKQNLNLPPLRWACDQLGLSFSLFLMGHPKAALPLAQGALDTRQLFLGENSPQTISAANRVATIHMALGDHEQAEALLLSTYQHAKDNEAQLAPLLEETTLLLTALYGQLGRPDDLILVLNTPPLALEADPLALKPETPAPILSAEDRLKWEDLAESLAQGKSPLAGDLMLVILKQEQAVGGGTYHPDLLPLYLKVSQFYLTAKEYDEAAAALEPLLALESGDNFIEISLFLGTIEEEAGFYEKAQET